MGRAGEDVARMDNDTRREDTRWGEKKLCHEGVRMGRIQSQAFGGAGATKVQCKQPTLGWETPHGNLDSRTNPQIQSAGICASE